jgi:hypothetical protein
VPIGLEHVDEAIDLFIKARTANPRVWMFSYELAGALGFKGDLEGGKAALKESLKLKPEMSSLAQWYAVLPWTSKTSAPEILGAAGQDAERGPAPHRFPGELKSPAVLVAPRFIRNGGTLMGRAQIRRAGAPADRVCGLKTGGRRRAQKAMQPQR